MRPGIRFGLSAMEKREVWSRWKEGQSLHEIGRAFDKPHSCIRAVLLPRGGIPPMARRRSRLALTLAEREDISRGIASGTSIREIANRLDRAASTVSREIGRHGGRPVYRAHAADRQAWVSALRPKRCLLADNRKVRNIVASKLILDWSPEQISGWLKIQYPDDQSMHVSHETIYRSLFIQARGVLKKELLDHLRSKRRMRRSRHFSEHGHRRGQIVDAISIREEQVVVKLSQIEADGSVRRPAEAEDRAIPGHWEGDLLSGGSNSYLATLVERHSRFLMLIKVPSKETEAVVTALSQQVRKLPATLRRSLTWDRGLEMAKHKEFTVATDVRVYFCDPQSPWQRGTNENTNLLLRQYFARGTDLSPITQAQLDQVSLRLNQRPRKTLGFETPASKLQQCCVDHLSRQG
jgi:IS30 family transposase